MKTLQDSNSGNSDSAGRRNRKSGIGRYSVYNLTKNIQIASEVELAATQWARLKGLIGRSADEFTAGAGLWISPCQGIHTIGMSFPIDVVYLDSARRALRTYHGLAPFRLAALSLKTRSVLEFPEGTLLRSGTQPGDYLELEALI
jgi:uncharacterized protein